MIVAAAATVVVVVFACLLVVVCREAVPEGAGSTGRARPGHGVLLLGHDDVRGRPLLEFPGRPPGGRVPRVSESAKSPGVAVPVGVLHESGKDLAPRL